MSATPSISPDPSLTHLGRYPSGAGRADVTRRACRALARAIPRIDFVAIGRTLKPYGPPRASVRPRSRATREFLFGPDVPPARCRTRRPGHRASRAARVQARRATAKAASGDSDGEPPGRQHASSAVQP